MKPFIIGVLMGILYQIVGFNIFDWQFYVLLFGSITINLLEEHWSN